MGKTASRNSNDRTSKHKPAARRLPTVSTRIGRLIKIGTNEWGKPLVECPRCGGTATTGRTGEVWCSECDFSTVGMAGCG